LGRADEALSVLDTVQPKLEEHKLAGWKRHVQSINKTLAAIYMEQEKHNEALPLLEEIRDMRLYLDDDEEEMWCLKSLV